MKVVELAKADFMAVKHWQSAAGRKLRVGSFGRARVRLVKVRLQPATGGNVQGVVRYQRRQWCLCLKRNVDCFESSAGSPESVVKSPWASGRVRLICRKGPWASAAVRARPRAIGLCRVRRHVEFL